MRLRQPKLHRCLSQQTSKCPAKVISGRHKAGLCFHVLYIQQARQYVASTTFKTRRQPTATAFSCAPVPRTVTTALCPKRYQSTAVAEKEEDDDATLLSSSSGSINTSLQQDSDSTKKSVGESPSVNSNSSPSSTDEQTAPLIFSNFLPSSTTRTREFNYGRKDLMTPLLLFNTLNELRFSSGGTAGFTPCHSYEVLLPHFASFFGLDIISPYLLKNTGQGDVPALKEKLDFADFEKLYEEIFTPPNLPYLIRDLKSIAMTDAGWVLNHSWRVIMKSCRYRPDMLPSLQIAGQPEDTVDPANNAYPNFPHVRVSNSSYDIVVIQGIDESNNIDLASSHALLDYCLQILQADTTLKVGQLSFEGRELHPSVFLSRACRFLGWRKISEIHKAGSALTESEDPRRLHQCQLYSHTDPLGNPGVWFTRKRARNLAQFRACEDMKINIQKAYAAGQLIASEYAVFASYWGEVVEGPPAQLKDRYVPHTITISGELLSKMVTTLRKASNYPLDLSQAWRPASEIFAEETSHPTVSKNGLDFRQGMKGSHYTDCLDPKIRNQRNSLPVRQPEYVHQIRSAVAASQVTIIKSSTGSGKTTQIPQLLLHHGTSSSTSQQRPVEIVCTQPRRVATVSVADRVAAEMGTSLGSKVGYSVRFDNRPPRAPNAISYMTSGYLLRLLESDHIAVLSKYTHIILDEVHERDIDTDLIMTALGNMMRNPPPQILQMPKLILMSATLDLAALEKYFGNVASVSSVNIPGKAFPVSTHMLEDIVPVLSQGHYGRLGDALPGGSLEKYLEAQQNIDATQSQEHGTDWHESGDLVESPPVTLLGVLIRHILHTTSAGDILVFLPGISEIDELCLHLEEAGVGSQSPDRDSGHRIFRLHSMLYETNYDVFEPISGNSRRIILSTNIAETSITLPNVTAVIDTGQSRQSTYDQSRSEGTFGLRWISKAEVTQRRGRAGRTRPGTYFATYSQARYEMMADKPTPELVRSPLDSVLLRTQASKAFDIPDTSDGDSSLTSRSALLRTPSPPSTAHVEAAIQQICNLHALTPTGSITAMGKVMARLPTTPSASKAILYGLIFRCLDPLLFAAGTREDIPLLYCPQSTAPVVEFKRQLSHGSDSDTWADWKAYSAYDTCWKRRDRRGTTQWTDLHYLRHNSFAEVKKIFNQTYETLQSLLQTSTPKEDQLDDPYKAPNESYNTPDSLNVNSRNSNLVKALSLNTAGNRVAYWNVRNWFTPRHGRVMPFPRSVNHLPSGMRSMPAKLRREPGDILMYSHLRNSSDTPHPWVYETSIVSPLAGLLFGEDVKLSSSDVLILNNSMQYKIEVIGPSPVTNPAHVAKVIFEYRKALDRFLAHALSKITLEPHKLKAVKTGKATARTFNGFLQEADHPLREIWVRSVVDILDTDARYRAERATQRTGDFNDALPEEGKLKT